MSLLLCGVLAGGSLRASAPSATVNEHMNTEIDAALTDLYNLDIDKAKTGFRQMIDQYPEHPMGLYGLTTSLWWELTNEYDEKNETLEKEFLATARQTIAMTNTLIQQGDPSGVGRLCQGGALGLVARWDAIQGRWMSAYRNGKQAFDLQSKAIEINPELYDAYLGPGIFHYYVAVLPAAIKFFARMVFGGSKTQGLEEIRLSMTRGRFSRTAARLFLVNIYTNNEKDPTTALTLLREGRKDYPDSPFFHFIELLILEEAKEWDALETGAEDFLNRIKTNQPYYAPKLEHRGLFALANSYLGKRQTDKALTLYNRILNDFPFEDRWISMATLNRGKTNDLLGRREDALADYRAVLKRRDVWQLHDKAKALIRRPYQGNQSEGPAAK
ncbi:MAG: tetratricopeptide repeat protein [Elusimicrobia bacterium]|nr:tetratricopeptide repeat protein [Elusimicrobiota bacterium]